MNCSKVEPHRTKATGTETRRQISDHERGGGWAMEPEHRADTVPGPHRAALRVLMSKKTPRRTQTKTSEKDGQKSASGAQSRQHCEYCGGRPQVRTPPDTSSGPRHNPGSQQGRGAQLDLGQEMDRRGQELKGCAHRGTMSTPAGPCNSGETPEQGPLASQQRKHMSQSCVQN